MSNTFIVSPRLPGESHSHYAQHNIRRNIMLCNLKPGDIINEAALADTMEISRTPVHEAVLSLRDSRLIDVIPRRESRVSYINLDYVNEGVFLRYSLEAELLRNLAGNISSFYLDSLRANLKQQQLLFSDTKNLDDFSSLDDEFHKCLYDAANKKLIYESVSSICSHLDRIRYLVRLEKDSEIEEASLTEHREILMFLSSGINPDIDLNLFFKKHIMRFQKKLPDYMERYSTFFLN